MKALVILVVLATFAYCRAQRRPPNFNCDRICRPFGYNPVCSDETPNRTYDNECLLDCKWKYKQCDGRCPCRQDNFNGRSQQPYRPQNNRPPYQPPYRPEARSQPRRGNICICDGSRDPVCTDQGTEMNECLATCHNKHILYEGECWLRRP
ncbi:insoluble matrix shell protein 6-like [Ruditapes philippinarum]|uniref:insoluble matrix shell protein 6-like n=1 Tax=Ruditapes philippinarum TaxID=129788 RepID=UPI00295BCE86|nr:insoluble matrix shell protein 6-like [Ruditapes philippinarum]